jgi:hypothetical protein
MTIPARSKRFQFSDAPQEAQRPKIWVEGRQRPNFDLKAYAVTAFGMAKRGLIPEMLDAEERLTRLGLRVAKGEVRFDLTWAGRLQRLVPSHQAVGRLVTGLAELFAGARLLLAQESAAPVSAASPRMPVAADIPQQRPSAVALEPTLHAIRSAISTAPHYAGLDQIGAPNVRAAMERPVVRKEDTGTGLSARLKHLVWLAACKSLLGILLVFAAPAGAIKAMMFHLDGGDLGDWS